MWTAGDDVAHPIYRFGRCQLDLRTRELQRDGRPCHLEPLAFDLLAYLLRHRGRPVTKDELFEEVWLGRIVSPGALARAAMAVRRAIGDDDGAQSMIATVHRVGYRFCADVTVVEATPPALPDEPPRVVALLPFENLTGDAALQWVPVGLTALVGHALAFDARLAPMSLAAVKEALRTLPRDAGFFQRAAALQRCGADCVVQARIVGDGEGYRLDYRCRSERGETIGAVYAGEPVRLGRALARRLMAQLLPGTVHDIDGFQVHDAWAMLVFARAMQAIEDGRRDDARHMLAVVLDLEPDYDEARCELDRLAAPVSGSRTPA
jgi:DNA-binding winged helix-turn-helix (wHTH) protein